MINNDNRQDFDSEKTTHIPPTSCAHGACPCSLSGRCDIWMEYQIACDALCDAEDLSHGNMIEIDRLQKRIDFLEQFIDSLVPGCRPV